MVSRVLYHGRNKNIILRFLMTKVGARLARSSTACRRRHQAERRSSPARARPRLLHCAINHFPHCIRGQPFPRPPDSSSFRPPTVGLSSICFVMGLPLDESYIHNSVVPVHALGKASTMGKGCILAPCLLYNPSSQHMPTYHRQGRQNGAVESLYLVSDLSPIWSSKTLALHRLSAARPADRMPRPE